MKYLSVKTIRMSLERIYGHNKQEHVTGTSVSSLLQNYFPLEKYVITPEQIQIISNKRPDFTVERSEDNKFLPHLFVEIKSLVNYNFNNIMDQLLDTIINTVDCTGQNFAVYVIAMKEAKIAFFVFHSYGSLLDEYGILNYNGFVPLAYNIPA